MNEQDADYYQAHKDDEGEWGEQVASQGERRRLSSMISVRFTPGEADLVRHTAEEQGRSVSDFVRHAALSASSRSVGAVIVEVVGQLSAGAWSDSSPRTGTSQPSSELVPLG